MVAAAEQGPVFLSYTVEGEEPAWLRTVYLGPGQVAYLSAALAGPEAAVLVAASLLGVYCLGVDEHVYAPAELLAAICPGEAERFILVQAKARENFAASQKPKE